MSHSVGLHSGKGSSGFEAIFFTIAIQGWHDVLPSMFLYLEKVPLYGRELESCGILFNMHRQCCCLEQTWRCISVSRL